MQYRSQLVLAFFLAALTLPINGLRVAPQAARQPVSQAVGPPEQAQANISKCVPPDDFFPSREGLSFLDASETHSAYGVDDGLDITVFLYDCALHKRLVFAHIPKNAGSTIAAAGGPLGLEWGGKFWKWNSRQMMPDGNTCSAWHVPPSMVRGYSPYVGMNAETFCVTRDPWDRVFSEYTYELKAPGTVNWAWSARNVGYACTGWGFNEYLRIAFAKVESGKRFIADCHFVPQWDYIEGWDGRKWCDHQLQLDQLTPQFNALMVSKGLSIRLKPHENKNPSGEYCPDLKRFQNESMGNMFSPENKAAMRRIYARDFAHLGDSVS